MTAREHLRAVRAAELAIARLEAGYAGKLYHCLAAMGPDVATATACLVGADVALKNHLVALERVKVAEANLALAESVEE